MKTIAPAVLAAALAAGTLAAPLPGQVITWPYYGKNRVLYESFQWRSYKTDHFEIFFYEDDEARLKRLAGMCESAYLRVSGKLKHELSKRVPLLYYVTFTDLEQSNVFRVSEGVLGVSEPVLFRTAVHGDMPLHELQDLLVHELTHVFEFDILWGSQGGALTALNIPPLWTFEGLSEFTTGKWSAWSRLIVRDAILSDRLPDLSETGDLITRYPMPRDPAYDFGHALYEFLAERYGPHAVRDLWAVLKNTPALSKRDPFQRAFNVKVQDVAFAFKKHLRDLARPFLLRESPEDYSTPIGPAFPINPYYFAFSHALSPSGEVVATITFNARDYDMDILLLSVKDGKVLKNVTRGYTTRYESLKYEIDPSLGRMLAWSPEGDILAFFARDGRRHSLFLIEAFSGRLVRRFPLDVDQPNGPCFTPDGRRLFLTGFRRGAHDIYRLDLESGALENVTRDEEFEKAPAVSPDGKSLVFSLRQGEHDKLFLAPVDDLSRRRQLTFGPGHTIAPRFSPDGERIFFSGDARDAYNVYSLDLKSGEVLRYTDVRTGNFFAEPLPGKPETIVFSSFNKSSFQLFRAEPRGVREEGPPASVPPEEAGRPARFEPIVTVDVSREKIEPYRGLGNLYVSSRPPIDAIVSTDGSIYGGSAVAFSDLMGDHQFSVVAYQVRSFRSYDLTYLNQRGRLQWMFNAFQFTFFYYPDYAYYDPYVYETISYRDAIAQRQMTGARLAAYYPFNLYYRAQASFGYYHFEEDYLDPYLMRSVFDRAYASFLNGQILQASFSLVGETTRFKQYGPAQGHTFALTVSQSLPVSSAFLSNTNLEADVRRYFYIGADFLLALRWTGFASLGKNPYLFYFGGNNQVRSANYYNIVCTEGWYLNAELRLPLITAASTVVGMVGPVRGVVFFDVARAKLKGYPAKFYYLSGPSAAVKEYDAIGSFGFGFEMIFLGLPIHVEFARRLYFASLSDPLGYESAGDYQAKFWVGFDF
jgi:Tol biopolymer transport system component